MGVIDRSLRILLALGIVALFIMDKLNGTVGAVLGIVAIIFLITSFISFCPLYTIFGFSSKKKEK